MPSKTKTITVEGLGAETLLALAYGSFENLNWTIKYAGENVLIAYVSSEWKKIGEEITIQTEGEKLTITSKMIHDQLLDLWGKNKKHIDSFVTSFESIKSSGSEMVIDWQNKIVQLREDTIKQAEEEIRGAEEIDKVMRFSKGSLYVTYGIIVINVLVFIVMAASGVSFISPTGEDILKWGGNYLPLTTSGEGWRIITCVFVHIGIIHLLFNMYALYVIGGYLEPMLGKAKYITAYLCTGVFASITSLWWHKTPVASAGASGAIFGMYGVFLALLSTNLIPKQIRKQMLQSIVIFVAYNLLYGLKSGIDNAAHVGGLISGLAIGYFYYIQLRKREEATPNNVQPILILLITAIATFFYLQREKPASKKDDSEKFSRTLEHFSILEEIAIEAMQKSDTTTKEMFLSNLKKTALIDWAECVNLFDEAEKLELPNYIEEYRVSLLEYSKQRVQQTLLIIKSEEEQTDKYNRSIDSIQSKITKIVEEVKAKGPPEGASKLPPENL
jgi:rhomboid protease GluP